MATAAQVKAAMDAGYSIDEIEQHLGNPGIVGKIQTALNSGYSVGEVDQHLSAKQAPVSVAPEMNASTAPMEDAMLAQTQEQETQKAVDAAKGWSGQGTGVSKFAENAAQMAKDYWATLTAPSPVAGGQYVKDSELGEGYFMPDGSFMPIEDAWKQVVSRAQNIVEPVAYPLAMIPSPVQPVAAKIAGAAVATRLAQAYGETDEQGRPQGLVGVGKAIVSPVTGLYDKFIGNPEKFQQDLENAPAETLFNLALELGVVAAVGKGIYEARKAKPTAEPTPEFQPSETGPVTRRYTAEDLTPASRQELLEAVRNQLEKIAQDKWTKAEASVEPRPEVVDYASWWEKNAPRAERGQTDLVTREVIGENGITPRIPQMTDAQVLQGIKQAQGRNLFDRAEAGKVDIITRQIRELDPYQEWWYNNAERMPERRIKPPEDIADFVDYRDVIQAETGASTPQIIKELSARREAMINDMVTDLKASRQGVENVRVSENDPSMGPITTGFYTISHNPKWYRDFYAQYNKAPTMADYREIAKESLRNGVDLVTDRLPKNENFIAVEKTIEALKNAEKVPDIIREGKTPNPVEAAEMLSNYHNKLYDATSFTDKLKNFMSSPAKQAEKGSVRAGVSLASDVNKSIFQRGKEAFESAYTAGIDALDPINVATKGAEKLVGKLAAEENPYILARNANSGATARAEMLVSGKTDTIPTLRKFYDLPHEATMQGVIDSLPKGKVSDALKADGFNTHQDALAGFLAAKRQLELQKNNPDYIGPMESAKAAKFVAENTSSLGKAADLFHKFNDNILQIAVDGGLVSPEVAAVLRTKYKNYASMARDFSDVSAMDSFFGTNKGYVNVAGVIKRIKDGSERAVVNPLETAIKNAYVVLSRVERNKVAQSVADLADVMEGLPGAIAKRVDAPANPTKSTFSVMRNGERQYYQTTPEMYRALTSMDVETAGMLAKVMAYPAGWLRAGATLDPGFFAKNVTRDAFTAALYSKAGFIPGVDTLRGVAALIGKPGLVNEFKASGAPMSVITAMDRNSLAKAIQNLDGKSLWANYNPVELLRTVTGFFENATRIREYEMVRNKGGSILDAATAAKDVTLDFSRKGGRMVEPNMIVSFLNAGLQGTDRFIRAMKDNPLQTTTRGVMAITIPSVALWMANHDDIRYQELPSYQRDLFWVIPTGPKLTRERFNALLASGKSKQQIMDEAGTLIRIPKPFEPGIVFGSLPERLLDYAYTKDPSGMSKWARTALQQLAPNIVPTAIAPILEGVTNHSFFTGRDIVPQSKEKLPAKMQYQPYNTEVSKKIGAALDNPMIPGGVSPAKIDNAIAGFFGGLGKTTIDAAELVAGLRNGRPDKLLTEQPIIRSFFITPLKGAESVQDFYEQFKRQSELFEEFKATKQKPADFNPALYNRLKATNTEIQALNKAARAIEASKISDDAKRKQMDAINLSVLNRARKATNK